MEKVTLIRQRGSDYIVNYENKKYVWNGARGNIVSRKDVPMEVYEWLASSTSALRDGELVLDKTNEKVEDLKEYIYEIEEYEVNSIPKDEVKKILEGSFKKMESELNKIVNSETKRYVLNIAREIGLESAAKQRFLKEWLETDLTIEELFPVE
jgi:hypothetical protein